MICNDKRRFGSKLDALLKANASLKAKDCDTDQFRAYQCPECHAWHLTKKV